MVRTNKRVSPEGTAKVLLPPAAAAGFGALTVCGLFGYIFYSPLGKQNDDHHILAPVRSQEEYERSIALIDALNARPYEPVSIRSRDGLRLAGRFYHTEGGAPLAILCHGYRGTPSRDFCGGADLCLQAGFNVLLIEERAHVSSGGHTITFGVRERYDVLDWTEYAVQRFGKDTKILLAGISMGAATVLMASELELPDNVRGILADCPYTSPAEIITEVGRTMKIPMKLALPLVELGARMLGGFSLRDADAAAAVRNAKVPILLIHGEADNFVPCDMSRVIAEANPAMVERHTFPDAGHGLSYLVDTARYARLVEEFCKKIGLKC